MLIKNKNGGVFLTAEKVVCSIFWQIYEKFIEKYPTGD